ncbi:MAG: pilus assembly protein [Actinomycetota bacterium]|nr:pilus assembly protein [Actinomycetota bacterium]
MKLDRGEQGEVFVETAIVGVVVMALSLGLLQFGLWYHAQHVVLGAAQDGARAAALDGARPSDGSARAEELVRAGLGSLASRAAVSATLSPRLATVRVATTLSAIVPFLPDITVRAQGRAFTERFIPHGANP